MAYPILVEKLDQEPVLKNTGTLDDVLEGVTNKHFTASDETALDILANDAIRGATYGPNEVLHGNSAGNAVLKVEIGANEVLGRLSGEVASLTSSDLKDILALTSDDIENQSDLIDATVSGALNNLKLRIDLSESGRISKNSVEFATTPAETDLNLADGTTITTINGVPVEDDMSVLVMYQTDKSENGVYITSTTGPWVRRSDSDGLVDGDPHHEVKPGTSYWVTSGAFASRRFTQYLIGTGTNQSIEVGAEDQDYLRDADVIPVATDSTDGLMSAADKDRLDNDVLDTDTISSNHGVIAKDDNGDVVTVVIGNNEVLGRLSGEVMSLNSSNLKGILNLNSDDIENQSDLIDATVSGALNNLKLRIDLSESGRISKNHVDFATTPAESDLDLTDGTTIPTINGVTVEDGMSVLVMYQTDKSQNGVYLASTTGPWVRRIDSDGQVDGDPHHEVKPGTSYWVTSGAFASRRFTQYLIGTGTNQSIEVGAEDQDYLRDADVIPVATDSTDGLMSAADKDRLDNDVLDASTIGSNHGVITKDDNGDVVTVVIGNNEVLGRLSGNVVSLTKSNVLELLNLRRNVLRYVITSTDIANGYFVLPHSLSDRRSITISEAYGAMQMNLLVGGTGSDYHIGESNTDRVYLASGDYGADGDITGDLSDTFLENDILVIDYHY